MTSSLLYKAPKLECYAAGNHSIIHNARERISLMDSLGIGHVTDFLIVKPPQDPADARIIKQASAALGRIAAAQTTLVSRGDDSGTHIKEKGIWVAVEFSFDLFTPDLQLWLAAYSGRE
jgi:cytochrome c556